jgi:hypothetical protein
MTHSSVDFTQEDVGELLPKDPKDRPPESGVLEELGHDGGVLSDFGENFFLFCRFLKKF